MITANEPQPVGEMTPEPMGNCCANAAYIPTFVVEDTVNLKGLHDCLVRVSKTNTTYYIDHFYRQVVVFQGIVFKPNYDFENNPLKIYGGCVVDYARNIVGFYAPSGVLKVADLHKFEDK